ncbi:uncharacterized protein LOC141632443 isoform X2 [Silene latifolia]|uniref:uncharacterized protein LOC141632443 isoform X2 n=1 Tax=Silene latifolia TaxID=37657 RepID=UPI003D78A695
MEGIVDSLTKYFHSANEALQKVKKHLLQLIQTLGEKIDEQRDLSSKQALNEICDSLREYGKRNQDFNDLMEMFDKLEDETTELRKKQTHTDVDYLVQILEEAPELSQFDEVRDMGEFVKFKDELHHLAETGRQMGGDVGEVVNVNDQLNDLIRKLALPNQGGNLAEVVNVAHQFNDLAETLLKSEFRSAVRAFILSSRSLNQVRDMGEFVKFKDELHHLAETGRQMGGNVDEVVNVNDQLNDLIRKLALPNQGGNLGEVVNVNNQLNDLIRKLALPNQGGNLGEFVNVNNQLNDLIAHQLNDLAETLLKSTLTPMGVDDLVQSSEGKSTKSPEIAQFAQEFRNSATSSVNLGLEALSIFDHNRNTTAESLQTLNEILEEIKNAGHVSWSPPVFSSKSWSANLGLQECIGWTDGMHS